MSQLVELREDLHELKELRRIAKRGCSQQLLDPQIDQLAKSIEKILEESKESKSVEKESQIKSYTVTLQTYSWDQSVKFLKLYVTIPGLAPSNASQVSCEFSSQGMTLTVSDLNSKNYKLVINNLAKPIAQERSHWKVKDEMVVVLLCKEREGAQWSAVTAEEAKIKNKNKPESDAATDPSANIMGLMKKMYDDGDDKMKQMLNKTWYETQMKTGGAGGMGGMGALGGMGGLGGMDL